MWANFAIAARKTGHWRLNHLNTKPLPDFRPSVPSYFSNFMGVETMPNRRYDRYESNGGHHLIIQIVESHAIQDLIKAIGDFFRHGASGKTPRDERECRQHRKDQRRRKPRRRHEDKVALTKAADSESSDAIDNEEGLAIMMVPSTFQIIRVRRTT